MNKKPQEISKTFCVLPWIHISETPNGFFKPCCNCRANRGEQLPITKGTNIVEAFNSPAMDELRQDFIDGKQNKMCTYCWEQEDRGSESFRQKYNNKFYHLFDFDNPQLKYWDVKFDNKCNLQCRMCNPDSSHQIWKTIDLFDITDTPKPDYLDRPFSSTREPYRYKDKKQELLDNLEHIRIFKVTGGEPFITDDFLEVMDALIEKGYAKNVDIECTTNGTKFYREYLDRFLHFRKIGVNVSLDGYGSSYDYIRYPNSWERINERLQDFFEFCEEHELYRNERINARFSAVISAYNWLDASLLYNHMKEYTLEYPWLAWGKYKHSSYMPKLYFDFNLGPTDSCLHIKYLPNEILQEGLDLMEEHASEYLSIEDFRSHVAEYMTLEKSQDKTDEFVQATLALDKFRNQDYKTLHPSLVRYIDENL